MASRYDDELWDLVPEEPGPPPGHLLAFVRGLQPAERALDLGCGDGRLTLDLRARRITAADPSPVALARAGRRLGGRATLVELSPGAPLPFGDSAFNLVLCAETLEHVQDVQSLLSEVRRVLRPGGTLALTTPAHGRVTSLGVLLRGFERSFDPLGPHIRFFTARGLRTLLGEMGFGVASLRRVRGTLLTLARR